MTATPIQVLLVEDNAGDARLIQEYLADAGGAGFKIETALTLANAVERCSRPGIDVVLLDLGLPDSVGLDTLKAFRSGAPELPVVVFTGLDDEKLAIQAVQAGAQDYLIKGESGGALTTRALRYAIERKRAEESLRENEERYRVLFERANDGIFVLSADGELVSVNESLARMHGYGVKEMLHMKLKDLDTPESSRYIPERMRRLLAGEALTFEVEHYHKNGHKFPLEVSASLISVGGKTFIQCFHRDITERKATETLLRQAQKMESVGLLAGGVAHDFNNMLQVIMGNAEMAADQMDPADPIRSDLEEIKKAGRRASDLTHQLLAFARRQTIAPRTLDLNEAVESMLQMLRRLIGENIELGWAPSAGLWPVMMDPGQVDQILINLCVNARDAIDGIGAGHIATENVRVDEFLAVRHEDFLPGDYVLLTVSDTGCGMNAETQARIFEPFFTTKELGKGTGLGLATVYGIVRQNKGHIGVYSEPGKGTTFRIHLPRHVGSEAAHLAEGLAQPVVRGCETVLLVEDDVAILNLSNRMLRELGYTVLAAGTPQVALRMADEHAGDIQLLVTDVVMPGMNVRELAETLQARHPNLKRLYMSGFTADVIAHQGVLDKGINFIQKPFSMADLAAKVREVLAGA